MLGFLLIPVCTSFSVSPIPVDRTENSGLRHNLASASTGFYVGVLVALKGQDLQSRQGAGPLGGFTHVPWLDAARCRLAGLPSFHKCPVSACPPPKDETNHGHPGLSSPPGKVPASLWTSPEGKARLLSTFWLCFFLPHLRGSGCPTHSSLRMRINRLSATNEPNAALKGLGEVREEEPRRGCWAASVTSQ